MAAGTVAFLVLQAPAVKDSLTPHGLIQDSLKINKGTSLRYSSNGRHTTTFSDGNIREEISFEGKITVSKDFTDIESISPNGHITHVRTVNDETKRIEIKSDGRGNLSRVYKENGKTMPYETAGKAYLTSLMPGLMAATGIGIEDYITSIYKQSGIAGVLRQADKMPGSHVKMVFVKEMLKQPNLKVADIRSALGYVSKVASSDYERRTMLTAVPQQHFSDEAVTSSYLAVAEKISSDYESRLALLHLLKSSSLSRANLGMVLKQVNDIGSDYEKAKVMEQLFEEKDFLSKHYAGALTAVAKIGSDYEKGKTLGLLVKRYPLSSTQYREMLPVVTTIRSDYEKSKVLQAIASKIPVDATTLRESYHQAVSTIKSDYERGRALKALK